MAMRPSTKQLMEPTPEKLSLTENVTLRCPLRSCAVKRGRIVGRTVSATTKKVPSERVRRRMRPSLHLPPS